MERVSEYFTMEEVIASGTADRHGIDNSVPDELMENVRKTARHMDALRRYLGVPIIITSWYRCPQLNGIIGSKGTSQHLTGQAVDFKAPGFGPPKFVAEFLKPAPFEYDQLILEYPNGPSGGWVHVSFTNTPRRQALIIDENGARAWA